MFRECWFLLLCILHLQYELTTSSPNPTVAPFTLLPTASTNAPTHSPTQKPSKAPTRFPTVPLASDEQIKIVVDVTISGTAIIGLCEEDMLDEYESSLVDVFIVASGVDTDTIDEAKLTTCTTLDNADVVLTYKMLNDDSRSRNIVKNRIEKTGEFLSTYHANLNVVFTDAEAKSVTLVEAEKVPEEITEDDPFKDFFSAYFGLGVIIFVVSVLWCFLLRANEGDVDQIRLKQLREEKRKFEEKYGSIEEDSVEAVERDIPKGIELADTTKRGTEETGEAQPSYVQAHVQAHVHVEAHVHVQPEPKEPETKPAETTYRASVVNEVKHVTQQEERASLDLDQIKDPGKKRRKTQEYLNNLWDDKNEAKEVQEDKDAEEVSEEETDEEEE